MKKFIIGLMLFAASTAFLAQSQKPTTYPAAYYPAYRSWIVTITPETQKTYIDSVVTVWKKDSIDLKFSRLDYNGQHKLVKIKGTVCITVKGNKASEKFDYSNLTSCKIVVDNTPKVSIKEN